MSKHKDPSIIRVGDKVEVVTPQIVKRVGYPKCIDDFLDEAKVLAQSIIEKYPKKKIWTRDHPIFKAIALQLLIDNGYGGRHRSVHLKEMPELAGKQFTVRDVKYVQEGDYCPGSGGGGYNSFTGDYDDYDPPVLAVTKVHKLLKIDPTEASLWQFHRHHEFCMVPSDLVKKL